MGAEDFCGGRQGLQLREGGPHLLSIALKHAPTSHGKQSVTCITMTPLAAAATRSMHPNEL